MTSATGIALNYVSNGSGRPVILLHGFGANSYSWRHVMSAIPPGYEFLAVDLKGFGYSPKPNDGQYSLSHQAEEILQFILSRNLRHFTIIGHSMGGGVALLLALKLKASHKNRLSSLVLIDTIAYQQSIPLFISLLQIPLLGPLGHALLPAEMQVSAIMKLAYFDDSKITKEAIDAYASTLQLPGSGTALVETAKQLIPTNIGDVASKYKTISVPTLLIWGRHDRIVPMSVGQRLHQEMKRSRFEIIENCGHIPHEERPEETITLINAFIQEFNKPT